VGITATKIFGWKTKPGKGNMGTLQRGFFYLSTIKEPESYGEEVDTVPFSYTLALQFTFSYTKKKVGWESRGKLSAFSRRGDSSYMDGMNLALRPSMYSG